MQSSHGQGKTIGRTIGWLVGLGAAALFVACGDDGGSGGGTGGAKATGGARAGGSTGSGGSRTGGTTGSGGSRAGGSSGSGGVGGLGGVIATGGGAGGPGGIDGAAGGDGAAGIDGAAGDVPLGTGGTAGTGGSGGTGGSDAAGLDGSALDAESIDTAALDGAPVQPMELFDFAGSSQGWTFSAWQETDSSNQPVAPFNLAVAGIQLDGGAMPTIGWDGTVGDPPGALRMTIDFSDWQQQVVPNVMYEAPLPSWTGRTLVLRVRVGAVPAASLADSGFVIYAQDGNWTMSKQLVVAFPTDTEWHTLSLPIEVGEHATFDASAIKSVTVGIFSSDPPAAPDGGVVPGFTPASVTVYVDSIELR